MYIATEGVAYPERGIDLRSLLNESGAGKNGFAGGGVVGFPAGRELQGGGDSAGWPEVESGVGRRERENGGVAKGCILDICPDRGRGGW